jgi:cation diffusion facilitator family transporter
VAEEHPGSDGRRDHFGTAATATRDGVRATWMSLLGLGVTAALQLVVVVLSGSVALLADTIHNVTDALTAIPLLIAFRLGRRLPTRRFTYGYHRAEDIAGLVIVGLIFASAVAAAAEAIVRLAHPRPLEHVWWVLIAGVVGFLGNEGVAVYRIRVGRRIGSAALEADGLHARADGLASLGVVVSALFALGGVDRADAVVGLAIVVAIGVTLVRAARTVVQRALDGTDEATITLIETVAAAVPGVEHVDDTRARWTGHRLLAELSVSVDRAISVREGHTIAVQVRDALLHQVPRLADATVHVDPHEHASHLRRTGGGIDPLP